MQTQYLFGARCFNGEIIKQTKSRIDNNNTPKEYRDIRVVPNQKYQLFSAK